MTDATTAPTRAGDRIDTLDVLRGIAICGILLMNIPYMGMIGDLARPPLPVRWDVDWIALGVQRVVFDGTMRGLFTMLFGAGMLLMLRRTFADDAPIAPIDVWTRRCLALMGLGVVQAAVFMWPGEILWNYGLCGLALLAFRTARSRTLLTAAAIVLVAVCALLAWQRVDHVREIQAGLPLAAARAAGKALTAEQLKTVAPLDKAREEMTPTPKQVAKEYGERTHLTSLVGWSTGFWAEYNLGSDAWPWVLESLGFMFAGMALYRTGILTGAAPPRVYLRLMLIGYPLGLALRSSMLWVSMSSGFGSDFAHLDPVMAAVQGALYEPGRLLVTLGHVGLIVMLFRRGAFGKAWPLRALGRMALTVYSLESILTSVLFYGFGTVGTFGFAALMGISVAIWVACALFCVWWLRRYDMGPAEQALRAVAYATFRRRREEGTPVTATTPAI